jgi:hypothetical protein
MLSKNLINFEPWKKNTVKKIKIVLLQIFLFVFILKIKEKSGIPFLFYLHSLQVFTRSVQKVFHCLKGLTKQTLFSLY